MFDRKLNRVTLISAVVRLIAGILFIAFPESIVNLVAVILGMILIGLSFLGFIEYFLIDRFLPYSVLKLLRSAVFMVVGVMFTFVPGFFMSIMAVMIGLYLILEGFSKLQSYLLLSAGKNIWWWLTVVLSILAIGFGISFIIFPLNSMRTIVIMTGIGFIISAFQSGTDSIHKY